MNKTILYIHGMGGGADSRIPRTLRQWFQEDGLPIQVICYTYDFDPTVAHPVIRGWLEEYKPDLIIGESLGSIHTLRIPDIPKILVSPALRAPLRLGRMAYLCWVPGGPWVCTHWVWRVKEGDRQKLTFRYRILHKYPPHFEAMVANKGHVGPVHAFYGQYDHYLRSGAVDPKLWEQLYGPGHATFYPGSHFMEEEYLRDLLVPKIKEMLLLDVKE